MNIGWMEVLVIVGLVVLIFGARRLPELGRSVGRAIREFQGALRGKSGHDEDRKENP